MCFSPARNSNSDFGSIHFVQRDHQNGNNQGYHKFHCLSEYVGSKLYGIGTDRVNDLANTTVKKDREKYWRRLDLRLPLEQKVSR